MEKKHIFESKKFLLAMSMFISFIVWVIITTTVSPTGELVISGVGVNINTQSGILGDMGLSAIYGGESTANVVISGTRSVIGGVSAEDITITPSLSGVSGSGTYDLELIAVNNSGKEFDIVSVTPEKISVKFDKYVDKTVDVAYVIEGLYNIPDEYIQEQIYTNPSSITVNGPETDMDSFDRAVVYVSLDGEYTESFSVLGEIKLEDENGNIYEFNKDEFTLSSDTASVVIPVHHIVDLPLYFQYTNVPDYLDTSKLSYTISENSIRAEGEKSDIQKYSDYFIGYVDLSELSLENCSYTFDVSLPENIGNLSGTEEIRIEYNLEDFEEKTFVVKQINIINQPSGYKITSNVNSVSVKMIGPKDIIETLSAKDIVVEVDASNREINQTGQYRMTADIVLPNNEFAWALGKYNITVSVK